MSIYYTQNNPNKKYYEENYNMDFHIDSIYYNIDIKFNYVSLDSDIIILDYNITGNEYTYINNNWVKGKQFDTKLLNNKHLENILEYLTCYIIEKERENVS